LFFVDERCLGDGASVCRRGSIDLPFVDEGCWGGSIVGRVAGFIIRLKILNSRENRSKNIEI